MTGRDSSSNGTTQAVTAGQMLGGLSVGDTFFDPDNSYVTVRRLSPAEAHLLVRERAPEAVIGVATRCRAGSVNPRTIEANSVVGSVWSNNLAVVVSIDLVTATAEIVVRSDRVFTLKAKRFPLQRNTQEAINLRAG